MLPPQAANAECRNVGRQQKVGPDVAAEYGREVCAAVTTETEKDERG